jgi:hypothetical protein
VKGLGSGAIITADLVSNFWLRLRVSVERIRGQGSGFVVQVKGLSLEVEGFEYKVKGLGEGFESRA